MGDDTEPANFPRSSSLKLGYPKSNDSRSLCLSSNKFRHVGAPRSVGSKLIQMEVVKNLLEWLGLMVSREMIWDPGSRALLYPYILAPKLEGIYQELKKAWEGGYKRS